MIEHDFQINGVAYCAPPLVQGSSFSPSLKSNEHTEKLSSDDVQGEGGDWYEVSRYGACLSPALGVLCPLILIAL